MSTENTKNTKFLFGQQITQITQIIKSATYDDDKTTEYAECAEIVDYNSNYYIIFASFCVVCGSKHQQQKTQK